MRRTWGKPVFNALTVQRRFAGERKLRETEAVAKVQPIPLIMHVAEVTIDDMGLVDTPSSATFAQEPGRFFLI